MYDIITQIPFGIKREAWKIQSFKVNTPITTSITGQTLTDSYTLCYQDPIECIKFLLGHRPFEKNLVYQPIWQYQDNKHVYTEMHTAEWWWKKQHKVSKLHPGATIVLIIFGSDKTLVTEHSGTKSAWPIYISIGNLDRQTRRSQTRPGMLVLGLLPIMKSSARDEDSRMDAKVYHQALAVIFQSK